MADSHTDVSIIPPVSDFDLEEAEGDSPTGQQDVDYLEERLAELNLTGASIRDSCPGDTGRSAVPGCWSMAQPPTADDEDQDIYQQSGAR